MLRHCPLDTAEFELRIASANFVFKHPRSIPLRPRIDLRGSVAKFSEIEAELALKTKETHYQTCGAQEKHAGGGSVAKFEKMQVSQPSLLS
jgi:hypothetical protein